MDANKPNKARKHREQEERDSAQKNGWRLVFRNGKAIYVRTVPDDEERPAGEEPTQEEEDDKDQD